MTVTQDGDNVIILDDDIIPVLRHLHASCASSSHLRHPEAAKSPALCPRPTISTAGDSLRYSRFSVLPWSISSLTPI